MSNKYDNQPGLEYEQPGLEVAPGSTLPEVVEGPTKVEKSYDDPAHPAYEQHYQDTFHQNNAYSNGAYVPTGYPPSAQPSIPAQSNWGSSQSGAYFADGAPPSGSPPNGGTILGLKKRKFWLIFAPLIALLVIGLAVGLGAGLGISHKSNTDSTPTSTAAPTPIVCPSANGTIYQGTGEDPFLVLCDVDYNSNGAGSGTTDTTHTQTTTFEDCIKTCATDSTCVGAGWGNYNGEDICWMKGSLGSSQSSSNWFFAIRQKKSN
ncbi:hypothetical protein F4781DRAFT_49098 [Annulohypoxylon bovei var. microspora]|nr:hypothetical protein F4781DRAFT_49098 [Annulohypoxylon bovei var. microspora]